MAQERFVLAGSNRDPQQDVRPIGLPEPTDVVEVSLVLRRRRPLPAEPPAEPMSREAFAERYGATKEDVERVEAFADDFDLTVVSVDLGRRVVVLTGTVVSINEAFGTTLQLFQSSAGVFRGRTGALRLPMALDGVIVGSFGLDQRPQARPKCRRHRSIGPEATGDTSYTPRQVAQLYKFPTNATGAGQTVAIIELGGGYRTADLQAYFSGLGLKTPSVTAVSVDGASNTPVGDPNSADGEVLLDIEVVGAIATGARIAVYFAPNTDRGFLDAITTAVHDSLRKPSVVSISWGAAESEWTSQSLTNFNQAFQDAGVLGVTICCASGDGGSSDGETDGLAHVDFPASSPHALACGGTRLESTSGTISRELVWNSGTGGGATGGGVSEVFPLPAYQQKVSVPVSVNPSHFQGRGVPDVAGDADPATGYQIRVDGRSAVFGGTSAVAPLWAALIAIVNQHRGKPLGDAHTLLYGAGTSPFRDVTSGTNGAYSAAKGWDPCTGLGSPNGQALETAATV
jgi:kumamolisin